MALVNQSEVIATTTSTDTAVSTNGDIGPDKGSQSEPSVILRTSSTESIENIKKAEKVKPVEVDFDNDEHLNNIQTPAESAVERPQLPFNQPQTESRPSQVGCPFLSGILSIIKFSTQGRQQKTPANISKITQLSTKFKNMFVF